MPRPNLFELLDTELKKLSSQLWLRHRVCYIFLVSACLLMVKLEPKRHYLVVKVGRWLDKLYIQVLRGLSGGRLRHLDLLLDDVLLLFL